MTVPAKDATSTGQPEPSLTDGVVLLSPLTVDDVRAAAGAPKGGQRRIDGWQTDGATLTLGVRRARDGELLGGCELHLLGGRRAELAYWTFPPFRGRGVAGRAARLVTKYALDQLGMEQVELYIEPDNKASRTVARKSGFSEQGVKAMRRPGGAERRVLLYTRPAPQDDTGY